MAAGDVIPTLVSTSSTLDFKTTDQSMWSSGQALTINEDLTLFSQSVGPFNFSAFDGDLSISAGANAALVFKLQGTAGGLALDYPIKADVILPNVVAAGQEFTVETVGNGLDTSDPHFKATFPEFSTSLQALFSANFSVNFSSDWFGSDSYSYSTNQTFTLFSLASGHHFHLADGFDFTIPTDYKTHTTQVGTGLLPTVTLNATTPDIATVDIDLIKLITDVADDVGIEIPPLSGSILGGSITFDLVSADLKAGLAITQQFQFVPTAVNVVLTAPWGSTTTIPLGESANFTVPNSWTQPITLAASYQLEGNLINQTGFIGKADLDVSVLSGNVSFLGSFGPFYQNDFLLYDSGPIYVFNPGGAGGFDLEGFNSPSHTFKIDLGTASTIAPGDTRIDTRSFSANNSALIQSTITAAAGSATHSNIYDPVANTGSSSAVAGAFNAEVIAQTGTYQLPTGFQAGLLEPGAGNASLTGNANAVLLAAAVGPGYLAKLTAGGNETMIGGQNSIVEFDITSAFGGSIAGIDAGDTIDITDIVATGISLSGSTLTVSYTGSETISGFFGSITFPVPMTFDIDVSGNFNAAHVTFQSDGNGGTDILFYTPLPTTMSLNLPIGPYSGYQILTQKPPLSGGANTGSTIKLMEHGQTLATTLVNGDSLWAMAPKLAAGDYTVNIVAVDLSGNTTPGDTTAPVSFTVVDGAATFSAALSSYAVLEDFGNRVAINGPDGQDLLFGINQMKFADGTVNRDDGNPLVNSLFYDSRYPDVFHAGVNAATHYDGWGWKEGRDPNPFFDTDYYLFHSLGVTNAKIDPLAHYDHFGWKEGLNPSPLFDTVTYLAQNPDVRAAGIDPLMHYLEYGAVEGRAIVPAEFNAFEYIASYGDLINALHTNAQAAISHFIDFGYKEGRHTTFDGLGYIASYPDLIKALAPTEDAGAIHYIIFGHNEGRQVTFDATQYLANYPDLQKAFGSDLEAAELHFIQYGYKEGRTDKPLSFSADAPALDHDVVVTDGATFAGGHGDTFVFNTPLSVPATIGDFMHDLDVLQISAAGFGHGLAAGAAPDLVAAASAASASHDGPGGYFIFDGVGTVFWDATGGSGADATVLAHLTDRTSLLPSDFHVV